MFKLVAEKKTDKKNQKHVERGRPVGRSFIMHRGKFVEIIYLGCIYLLIGMITAGILACHWFRPGMADAEYWKMMKTCIIDVFFWPAITAFVAISLIEWVHYKILFKLRDKRKDGENA